MRGVEILAIEVEALYELERSLWRYPGLELESVSGEAWESEAIEDEDTGEYEYVSVRRPGMGQLLFRGPNVAEMGRPRAVVPISLELLQIEDGYYFDFLIDDAVRALENLIRQQELVTLALA